MYDWLKIEYPNRRVSDLPLMFVTPHDLAVLHNSANSISVAMYGQMAWDIDENEVGIYNGHRLFLLERSE